MQASLCLVGLIAICVATCLLVRTTTQLLRVKVLAYEDMAGIASSSKIRCGALAGVLFARNGLPAQRSKS